jgi:hypothetical protein
MSNTVVELLKLINNEKTTIVALRAYVSQLQGKIRDLEHINTTLVSQRDALQRKVKP